MTTRAEAAEVRENAAEQKRAELQVRAAALLQQAKTSDGQADAAREKMATAMSNAAAAATHVERLSQQIVALRQDKEEESQAQQHKQTADEQPSTYGRSVQREKCEQATQHSGKTSDPAPEPEAVLLAISDDKCQDHVQQEAQHGSNVAQLGQQPAHTTILADVVPPRTPRRAALETLNKAGWLTTSSSLTGTRNAIPDDDELMKSRQLQVNLGAITSHWTPGPIARPMVNLAAPQPQPPPPRSNLPVTTSIPPRRLAPPPPMIQRTLRMAKVASTALPDRLEFPDYRLSHRTPRPSLPSSF